MKNMVVMDSLVCDIGRSIGISHGIDISHSIRISCSIGFGCGIYIRATMQNLSLLA